MRPIKLVMSAFGPFSRETEIDFELIGSEGLFLITGDTGSGKPSVLPRDRRHRPSALHV